MGAKITIRSAPKNGKIKKTEIVGHLIMQMPTIGLTKHWMLHGHKDQSNKTVCPRRPDNFRFITLFFKQYSYQYLHRCQ